jgi:tetratricopeptide (TPR) repeat protein
MMARVLLDEDELPQARRALEYALRLEPDHEPARFLLANCLSRLGETDRARALAEGLLASAPDAASSHVALAVAELSRVRTLRLRWPLLLVGLVITRGGVLVVLALVRLYHEIRNRGPLRRADRAVRDALRLAPQDAVVLGLAAQVLTWRGHRLAAVDRRVRAARADSAVADARGLAADLRRQQVLVEAGLLASVGVLWALAAVGGPTAGAVGLAVSAAGAIGFAVVRRRRLRSILPRSLWTTSVGGGWAAWLGPALAVTATVTVTALAVRAQG